MTKLNIQTKKVTFIHLQHLTIDFLKFYANFANVNNVHKQRCLLFELLLKQKTKHVCVRS